MLILWDVVQCVVAICIMSVFTAIALYCICYIWYEFKKLKD